MKRLLQLMLAGVVLTAAGLACGADPADLLISDRWDSRPLVIVSPSESDSD